VRGGGGDMAEEGVGRQSNIIGFLGMISQHFFGESLREGVVRGGVVCWCYGAMDGWVGVRVEEGCCCFWVSLCGGRC